MAIRMGLPPRQRRNGPILLFPRSNSLRVEAGCASSMLLPPNKSNRTGAARLGHIRRLDPHPALSGQPGRSRAPQPRQQPQRQQQRRSRRYLGAVANIRCSRKRLAMTPKSVALRATHFCITWSVVAVFPSLLAVGMAVAIGRYAR
jgi:hypothetical protein